MRAYPLSLHFSSYPLFFHATATSNFSTKFFLTSSIPKTSVYSNLLLCPVKPKPKPSNCSNNDYSLLDTDDDDDDYVLVDEGSESLSGDGVHIEIKKLGRNSRRIRSKIEIAASLDTVWNILTDYEKLVDLIPGLAVSELVEKKDNFARLYQIGQQNLPFGLKFNAKGVLDCYEKHLENLPSGKKRDIEFKMIEGDFQFFEGKWSLEQCSGGKSKESSSSLGQELQTTLSYLVDVKPKLWLPVRLVEGRLCNEIKSNLTCIREAAQKVINEALNAH
ncbi:hypothetical protein Patl1_00753 [Pistacia atlantica]|uniref:Uncharacterized protein n=1 Tax=Pistacia atlantica TaxID=434234 RepID=A0ACC1C6J1_9ROSI|nr:hypothetical protein Patl1_00753 [Pistacia atlantica]